ncbi:MAG: hypothetical protein M3Q10_11855 [Chloroflexota bacterium]|nr:hypothetical protein [Chloroflexota bacterium]
MTIPAGTTARRVNEDAIIRDVMADDYAFNDLGLIEPGWFYEQTFNRPGVDRYRCGPYGGVEGTVMVTEASDVRRLRGAA